MNVEPLTTRSTLASQFFNSAFSEGYWGLLGIYRDLTRQTRYLNQQRDIHPVCIEDIEFARDKIERLIEPLLPTWDQSLGWVGVPVEVVALIKQKGLRQWAEDCAVEGY